MTAGSGRRSSASDACANRSDKRAPRCLPTESTSSAEISGSSGCSSRRLAGAAAARSVALTASSRTEPSSIHVSSVRSSIFLRSSSGSRGARGARRILTSSARFSASVNGRDWRRSSLRRAPPLAYPPREEPPEPLRPAALLVESPRRGPPCDEPPAPLEPYDPEPFELEPLGPDDFGPDPFGPLAPL